MPDWRLKMTHLIQIGNSQGIRIPKTIIQQARLMDAELMLTVVPEGLLITPVRRQQYPRAGWATAFANAKPEKIILDNINNSLDEQDWEW